MNLGTNRHLDESEIEKYSAGDVPEEEASRYEEHLLICEACQERVAASDEYVEVMREASARIRQNIVVDRPSRWQMPRPIAILAIAASLMLAFFLGFGTRLLFHGGTVSPVIVNMVATRGNDLEARAPVGKPLTLNLNVEGLNAASYGIEIVDESGKSIWRGSALARGPIATADAPAMSPGHYFLRAYSPASKLLREYGLQVQAD